MKGTWRTRGERETPQKRCYFAGISLSSMKTVADRHRHALIISSTSDDLCSGVNINDLQWPWTAK